MASKKTKRTIIIALVIIEILAISIFLINLLQIPEIIECERLTKLYGEQFENPDMYPEDSAWTHDILDVKVLEYTPEQARVYCICNNGYYGQEKLEYGTIVTFEKDTSQNWLFARDMVAWSDSGNGNMAENIVPPYWYHQLIY